ncbi:MAG: M48 family metalloprotease [Byssovorax sp.]
MSSASVSAGLPAPGLLVSTPADRIEDIRVAWERDLERTFASYPIEARDTTPDRGARDPRVVLEKSMAERVHRVAREAAERLGCTEPFVIYQTPNPAHLNAQALLSDSPFAVRLIGPVAKLLDDAALAALVGHEIGHWMALGPLAKPESILLQAGERGASEAIEQHAIMASELTADRFSLLAACGEVEAVVRLEVALKTFDCPRAMGLNEIEYLDEVRGRVVRGEDEIFVERSGYPTPGFRLYATWLFWRSEVHHQLTGKGPSDLALRVVDAKLQRMCDNRLARAPVRREPRVDAARATNSVTKGENPRGPASPSEATLGDRARAAASSVASTVGRFVDLAVVGRGASVPVADAEDDDAASGLDELDDLEARFRELEALDRTR